MEYQYNHTPLTSTTISGQLVRPLYASHTDEILSATLPEDIEDIPSGFATVGHIAHMNLRDYALPYKYHIGAVVLSKTASQGIKTVVNKLDTIDSTYRNFKMEVLAGEENFIVTQNHLDCEFTMDFSKVYWNSRLNTEHGRLVEMFHPGEGVCDVFAGVGPFAVPAGKKRVFVMANDLNPVSYLSMVGNIKTNKVLIMRVLTIG
jgi:tRNA (guanine37-N1)-methyltransferase